MFGHRLFRIATALALLQSTQALAADVVTLRCDYPGYYQKIIADQRGISLTQYQENKNTGKLEYVKSYTENKKVDTSESYYRTNSVEIAYGSKYNLPGAVTQIDSTIDLRTGIKKDDMKFYGIKDIKERPTEIGNCKPD